MIERNSGLILDAAAERELLLGGGGSIGVEDDEALRQPVVREMCECVCVRECACVGEFVCVRVCVSERERERAKKRDRNSV